MELNDNDTLLVERYLTNELNPQERSAFEQRLAADAPLAAYVQAHAAIDAGLERQQRKARFAQYERNAQQKQKDFRMMRYAAAAAATMLLAAGVAVYLQWRTPSTGAPNNIAKTEQPAQELIHIAKSTIAARPDTGMGFAGTDSAQAQIPVWLTAAPPSAQASYLFKDTLQLFVPLDNAAQLADTAFQQSLGLALTYDRTRNDTYLLNFKGKKYELKRYTKQPETLE